MSLIQKFAKYNHYPLSIIETCFFSKYPNINNPELAPIFIVGAPRTGSTILYQILSSNFEILYINNLISKFYRNIIIGFWLNRIFFNNIKHQNYRSDFGNTDKYGFTAPSECGDYWYQWLRRDQHFIDYPDVTNKMIETIKSDLNTVANKYKKPILIKNLAMGQRLRLIHEAFPNARIIFIRRNPVNTAKSIITARHIKNISENEWWSIKPPNYKDLIKLPEYQKVIAQIYFCEKQIKEDIMLFRNDNIVTIYYEELLKNPDNEITSIAKRFNLIKTDNDPIQKLVMPSSKTMFDPETILLLEIEVKKYVWD